MLKKVVIVKVDNEPIDVLEVKEVTPAEYYKLVKECEKRKTALVTSQKERIDRLELEIKYLKGDISEGEYKKVCNGGKL